MINTVLRSAYHNLLWHLFVCFRYRCCTFSNATHEAVHFNIVLFFLEQFAVTPLIFVGAFALTFGGVVLSRSGTSNSRLMPKERQQNMDAAGKTLKSKKCGGFILTFLFSLKPMPSNEYFLTLGTMNCNYFTIYAGFGLGIQFPTV
jgi:hypothetical protein